MIKPALKKLPAAQKRVRAKCFDYRSSCHLQLKEYPAALQATEAAIEEDATFRAAWNNKGTAHGFLSGTRRRASLEWPRCCSKACQTADWKAHLKVCVSKSKKK